MLRHIPFYATLLGRQMADGKKSTQGIVLLYGAVEVHAMGEYGCIASNETLAKETGMKKESVKVYLSKLSKSGWIRVNLDENSGRRLNIEPLLDIADPLITVNPPLTTINPPLITVNPPLTTINPPLITVNHRYSIENSIEDTPQISEAVEKKYSEDDERITDRLYQKIAELFPTYKKLVDRKPSQKDYEELNKLHRLDGNSYKLIEDVLKWLYRGYKPNNDFDWKDQIKSTRNLRKHFDKLRTQYEKDKNQKKYVSTEYSSKPPSERAPTPIPEEVRVPKEESEKNLIVLQLVREKKIAISDMKLMKSKPIGELRDMLDSV